MTKKETVKMVFEKVGTIVKTSDFNAFGLKNYDVANLCDEGMIKRIRNGFYTLSNQNEVNEELLIAKLMPQGIICVESALFYYGYSDFTPREWTIAIPRSASRTVKKMKEVPIKAYFIRDEVYPLGKTEGIFNGVVLPVYDRERTICDCFKYRTKLDNELFNKAVTAYAADDKKNLSNLSKYAKEMRVYGKLMAIMEVLLNG